uniref:TLC domain-containing protein n=1 Tax=Syphacia muris TaxID=451379 RepID=A0A0N5AST1_9BILA
MDNDAPGYPGNYSHIIRFSNTFRQHRLQNISVSLMHSTIVSTCALIFTIINPNVMFRDTIHWYCDLAAQLVYLSMGYFVYDTVDMLRHDSSVYALQIVAHHVVVVAIFSVGMLPKIFLPYAYWALLVEFNWFVLYYLSRTDKQDYFFHIFLHIRSLMQLSNNATNHFYQIVRPLTIITFVIFRFGVLSWMLQFIVRNRDKYHIFYTISGSLAVSFFLAFSAILFRDVLSDRVVGDDKKDKKKSNQKKPVSHTMDILATAIRIRNSLLINLLVLYEYVS